MKHTISDAGRTMQRKDDRWPCAPFIPGAVYQRIDLQTGLYEWGTLKCARELNDGRKVGTVCREGFGDVKVTDGTASFAEWALYASPEVLDAPVAGKHSDQYTAAIKQALENRAKVLAKLVGKVVRSEGM